MSTTNQRLSGGYSNTNSSEDIEEGGIKKEAEITTMEVGGKINREFYR